MTTTATTLDARGKSITTWVVFEAAHALDGLDVGDVLELFTDDFEPFEHDLATWCRAAGHRISEGPRPGIGRRFLIEKGAPLPTAGMMAMVVSNAGLEELLSPLGFALAAALEGVDVRLFIQGPAVRVLARGYRPKLSGWARPFTRLAAAGMARSGHIEAQGKLRQLRALGGRIYVCGPSMEHFKVRRDELVFDDLPIVEYLTFVDVMRRADIQLYT